MSENNSFIPGAILRDIQQVREEARKAIAKADEGIRHMKEFVCDNCDGMGWRYKNGFDSQTCNCTKCKGTGWKIK